MMVPSPTAYIRDPTPSSKIHFLIQTLHLRDTHSTCSAQTTALQIDFILLFTECTFTQHSHAFWLLGIRLKVSPSSNTCVTRAKTFRSASTPFTGTVTLYAASDCKDSLDVRGLGVKKAPIKEGDCLDDTFFDLGFGGYRKFHFDRIGDGIDPTSQSPKTPFALIFRAFRSAMCGKIDGEKPSLGFLKPKSASSACINTKDGVVAAGFKFVRFKVAAPLGPQKRQHMLQKTERLDWMKRSGCLRVLGVVWSHYTAFGHISTVFKFHVSSLGKAHGDS